MNIDMNHKYQREDGAPVKIICIDRVNPDGYCVVGLVQDSPYSPYDESVESWKIDGTRDRPGYDLVPVPTKHDKECNAIDGRPKIIDWAMMALCGRPLKTQTDGTALMLIEAGRKRGKSTLGMIAALQFYEKHATPSNHGYVILPTPMQARWFTYNLLVEQFHGELLLQRQERTVSLCTRSGEVEVTVSSLSTLYWDGRHDHSAWVFLDNVDLIPEKDAWKIADRLDPKLLIFSQSVHTFASTILVNKCNLNVLTDPELLKRN